MGSEYDIMLDEKNEKIWALERELAETKAVTDIVLERGVALFNCLVCEDAKKAPKRCSKKRCIRNIKAWALAEARKGKEGT